MVLLVRPIVDTVDGGVTSGTEGCFGSWLSTTSGSKGSNPTALQDFVILVAVIALSQAVPRISKKSILSIK